jgi:hypothetical protein
MMKTFKKPDLNAPRYRQKCVQLLSTNLYKKFKAKYPEHDISYNDFKKIIHTYNIKLREAIMEYRDGVELPESLGYIFIGSCAPISTRLNVDYGKSIKYGVLTTHKNWNSDSRLMKIFYTNYLVKYKLKNKDIWMLAPHRTFKRTASKVFAEDYNKYIKIDPTKKVSVLFKGTLTKTEYRKKIKSQITEGYNEFDI